jgi:drug/metabolite transporter (DMT)-like permease
MQMLTPLGVAIGSVWFYQEHFSLFESVGAVLILGGTMIPAIRQQVRLRES